MDDTRRGFMRSVGITMLGLLGARAVAGCKRDGGAASSQDVRPADGSTAPSGAVAADGTAAPDAAVVTPEPEAAADVAPEATPTTDAAAASVSRLDPVRACWLGLLAWQAQGRRPEADHDQREAERDRRKTEHRAALDAAVEAGELQPPIAQRLAAAFDEAAFHVWRSSAGMTCYRMTMAGSRLAEGRGAVLERLAALQELADRGAVDAQVAADARETFERELVLFDGIAELETRDGQARWEAERQLVEQLDAGGVAPDADDVEAARVLVDLLLARPAP